MIFIQTAAAVSVSVQTDQSYYYKGDSIQVSGTVDTITGGTLSYGVTDGNSNLVVDGSTVINPDSSFSFNLDTSGGAWSGDGLFSVDVSFEEDTGSAGFEFINPPSFTDTVEGMKDLDGNPITQIEQGVTFEIKFSLLSTRDIDMPVSVVFQVVDQIGMRKQFTEPDIINIAGNTNTNYSVVATFTLNNVGTSTITFEVWKNLDDQINLISSPLVFNIEILAPPDADSDGIPDSEDSCVNEPETFNGFEDADGCPDEVPPADSDNDGYTTDVDCNDNDSSINPGATEIPGDGIDQDCDGVDAALPDNDNDGYTSDVDCNDNDSSINPGAEEVANDGIDQDCDGSDLVTTEPTPEPETEPQITPIPDSTPDPEADRYNEAYTGLHQTIYPKVEQPILEDFDDVQKPEPVQEKQETRLAKLQDTDDPKQLAKDSGMDYDNGKTRLLIVVDMQETTMTKIEELGQVEASSQNQIQLVIEIDKIPQLLEIEEIKNIRPVNRVIQSAGIISEGVEFVNADDVQLDGLTGKGVKVAVLDIAFDSENSKISSKIKESKSFRFDFGKMVSLKGSGSEARHGTAVAEIISDVAPDAELYLYTFSSELEFDEAALYAAKKVDLIAMSAGWTNYPTDGTSSMTKTIEKIISGGTTFVISAGNYAETHWEGTLTDSDSNGWHEFKPGDEGLSFNVDQSRVSSKVPILVYLMWEEASSGVYDLDLSLIHDDTEEVVDISANVQLGKGDAFEYIYFTPTKPGIYSLGISYEGAKHSTSIEIFSPSDRVEYATAQGSVGVPTDARG